MIAPRKVLACWHVSSDGTSPCRATKATRFTHKQAMVPPSVNHVVATVGESLESHPSTRPAGKRASTPNTLRSRHTSQR